MTDGGRLVEHPAGWLWLHVGDDAAGPVPVTDGPDDVAVGWLHGSIRCDVVDRAVDRIQHEDRRPAVVVDGFLFARLEDDFEHPQVVGA